MSEQIGHKQRPIVGVVALVGAMVLGFASFGHAAPQISNSLTANGTFVADGDTYTFHIVASENGDGTGSVLYTLAPPIPAPPFSAPRRLSLCSLFGPILDPGPNTPRPVFVQSYCDIATNQRVTIDDNNCSKLEAEVHSFAHADVPYVDFIGGATVDLRLTNVGLKQDIQFTVYTARKTFTVKGNATFTDFTCNP